MAVEARQCAAGKVQVGSCLDGQGSYGVASSGMAWLGQARQLRHVMAGLDAEGQSKARRGSYGRLGLAPERLGWVLYGVSRPVTAVTARRELPTKIKIRR